MAQYPDWQPIETAPKDGTIILLWDPQQHLAVSGCWHVEPTRDDPSAYEPGWSWWVSDGDVVMWDDGDEPAYWAPFSRPAPTAAPASEAEKE